MLLQLTKRRAARASAWAANRMDTTGWQPRSTNQCSTMIAEELVWVNSLSLFELRYGVPPGWVALVWALAGRGGTVKLFHPWLMLISLVDCEFRQEVRHPTPHWSATPWQRRSLNRDIKGTTVRLHELTTISMGIITKDDRRAAMWCEAAWILPILARQTLRQSFDAIKKRDGKLNRARFLEHYIWTQIVGSFSPGDTDMSAYSEEQWQTERIAL